MFARRPPKHQSSKPSVWLPLVALFMGCNPVEERPKLETDCSVEDDFEFLEVSPAVWFGFGDSTPGGLWRSQGEEFSPEETEDRIVGPKSLGEEICGRTEGLVFRSRGHKDWGSQIRSAIAERPASAAALLEGAGGTGGETSSGEGGSGGEAPELDDNTAFSAAGYEGLAFWARSPGPSNIAVNLLIETSQTAKPIDWDPLTEEHPFDCMLPEPEEGAIETIQADGTVISSSVTSRPKDCGNPFAKRLKTSRRWELYLLPFDSFHQEALPNRKQELASHQIYAFGMQIGREFVINMEVAGFSYYRRR